ncbi:hypothetical protein DPEC_G00277360, partial [Dallia pectoralis]
VGVNECPGINHVSVRHSSKGILQKSALRPGSDVFVRTSARAERLKVGQFIPHGSAVWGQELLMQKRMPGSGLDSCKRLLRPAPSWVFLFWVIQFIVCWQTGSIVMHKNGPCRLKRTWEAGVHTILYGISKNRRWKVLLKGTFRDIGPLGKTLHTNAMTK